MVALHVLAVIVALGCGIRLLASSKGTRRHRIVGWVYVAALVVTAGSSFGIYEVRAGLPSVFHVVSVVIAVVLAAGLVSIRRFRNQRLHLIFMTTSFLMMVVTGIAQFFDHLPFPSEAVNAIVFLQLPSIIGFTLIWRAAGRTARAAPRAT